ncbi:MAG: glycoside hydrolase family 16 protein [Planctomycetaceae bacterium]|nr:glycoside hydrolase family 16 protein [Planctomycetaceae bacterium]
MKTYCLTLSAAILLLSAVDISVLNAEENKSKSGKTTAAAAIVSSSPVKTLQEKDSQKRWRLVWQENFDGNTLNMKTWSKISRWNTDWAKHMSDFDGCYEVKDGQLILRGLRNEYLPKDKSPYLTGGVHTKGKISFRDGRVEIRAKLGSAQGAWPAFWMMPVENIGWPRGGEIDIMERLNNNNFVYQTVHSYYTNKLKINNPPQSATGKINPDDYNVYAVEMNKDYLSFFVNGKLTFTYPRIETDKEGQFPFDREFYLMLDMQLGGSWVGEVNPNDLPIEMLIDWVRFYKEENPKEDNP